MRNCKILEWFFFFNEIGQQYEQETLDIFEKKIIAQECNWNAFIAKKILLIKTMRRGF